MLTPDIGLTCRNFKCISEMPQGFRLFKPINVIVGRNNSGKSTLLDLLEYAHTPKQLDARVGHKRQGPTVFVTLRMTKERCEKQVPNQHQKVTLAGNAEHNLDLRNWSLRVLVDKDVTFELGKQNKLEFPTIDKSSFKDAHTANLAEEAVKHFSGRFPNYISTHGFRRLLADRDIKPEPAIDEALSLFSDGRGLTKVVERHLHSERLDRRIVEQTLLTDLNSILNPDVSFTRLLALQQHGAQPWELYLEEPHKGLIPLSQTGSGIKTIMLVLANVLLAPRFPDEPHRLDNMIFAFEELENNLHPAIQRRLFRYLRDKAITEKCNFVITTHSHVVIDMFSRDENAQILHVTHDNVSTTISTVSTSSHGTAVLDDLDVRASDLLQTNAVVWVEGPSDRIYFNKWVELWSDGELVEGEHYQCLLVGGSCNAHFSFEDDPAIVDDLISALKINRHAILLADSDKRDAQRELKPHTSRLAREVANVGGYAWVTAGKEVENYIPIDVFRILLADEKLKGPGEFSDVFKYIEDKQGKTKPRKTDLAHRVVECLTKESLAQTLDLAERLDAVCKRIREWNRLDGSTAASR